MVPEARIIWDAAHTNDKLRHLCNPVDLEVTKHNIAENGKTASGLPRTQRTRKPKKAQAKKTQARQQKVCREPQRFPVFLINGQLPDLKVVVPNPNVLDV